jgi:hypothetical protein
MFAFSSVARHEIYQSPYSAWHQATAGIDSKHVSLHGGCVFEPERM